MAYCEVWQFRVRIEHVPEFEAAYGPAGVWASLFQRAEGFVGTELLRSRDDAGTYVTIDRWTSESAFHAFTIAFAEEYRSLDERLEPISGFETRIGAFFA